MKTPDIKLVGKGSRIYNACDRTGYHCGVTLRAPARVYSVYAVDIVDGVESARTEAWDIFGARHEASFPLHTLEPFGPKQI